MKFGPVLGLSQLASEPAYLLVAPDPENHFGRLDFTELHRLANPSELPNSQVVLFFPTTELACPMLIQREVLTRFEFTHYSQL